MAFGQRQVIVGLPQPGTSNQPFAKTIRVSGGFLGLFPRYQTLPPYVPVVTKVIDSYAAAVASQTSALEAILLELSLKLGTGIAPETLNNDLADMAVTLNKIYDRKVTIAKALTDLNIAIGTMAVSQSQLNMTNAVKTADQVIATNFEKMVSGEKPTLPSIQEQIKTELSAASDFNSATTVSGYVQKTINASVTTVTTWIAGTEAYQSATEFIKKSKDSILSVLPFGSNTVKVSTSVGKEP